MKLDFEYGQGLMSAEFLGNGAFAFVGAGAVAAVGLVAAVLLGFQEDPADGVHIAAVAGDQIFHGYTSTMQKPLGPRTSRS